MSLMRLRRIQMPRGESPSRVQIGRHNYGPHLKHPRFWEFEFLHSNAPIAWLPLNERMSLMRLRRILMPRGESPLSGPDWRASGSTSNASTTCAHSKLTMRWVRLGEGIKTLKIEVFWPKVIGIYPLLRTSGILFWIDLERFAKRRADIVSKRGGHTIILELNFRVRIQTIF